MGAESGIMAERMAISTAQRPRVSPQRLQSHVGKTDDRTGDKDGFLEVGVGDNVPRYFLEVLGLVPGAPVQVTCFGTQSCVA